MPDTRSCHYRENYWFFPWFVSFSSNFIRVSHYPTKTAAAQSSNRKKSSNLVLSIQDDNNHSTPSTSHKGKNQRARCGRGENARTHWLPKCNIRAGTCNHQSKEGCKVAVQLLLIFSYLCELGKHSSLFMCALVYTDTNITACLLSCASLQPS